MKAASYNSTYRKIKVGDTVRLKEPLETNGGDLLAKGLIMRVVNKHGGLHLESINDKPCQVCGIGRVVRITKVSPFKVEKA